VTLDENLPIVEVDDSSCGSFMQEFQWLLKVHLEIFCSHPVVTSNNGNKLLIIPVLLATLVYYNECEALSANCVIKDVSRKRDTLT
jgi:hypothetical protein